ncbi:MAG: GumC family protein [bacterium]
MEQPQNLTSGVTDQTPFYPVSSGSGPRKEIHLRDYWRIISKRRWTVITVFIIILLTTIIVTLRKTPIYRATIKLQIDSENPNVISIDEVMNVSPSDRDYNQTQYKLLQSRKLAKAVIEELKLDENPEFFSEAAWGQSPLNPIRILFSVFGKGSNPEEEDAAKMSGLINAFLERLKVEPERNTRLVNVSFTGEDPEIITRIANTHARLFIEQNLLLKADVSTEAIEWLDQHLGQLKKTVEESETELHRYKEENNIVSLEEKQNIIVQRLSDLNTAVTQAKTERIRLETVYNQITKYAGKEAVIESLPSVINNKLIQELKAKYITLQAEHRKVSQKLGNKHPHIIEITSEMKIIRDKIQSEVKKIIDSIKTEYEIALAQETVLKEALEEQKKEAIELNEKAIRYGVLKREAESNEQVFNMVLNRLKETDLTRGLKASNIRVIDPAEVPRRPIKPRKALNIFLAVIVGLMSGTALALFFEYLDDTVKTPEDLKRYFDIPFLGPIPHHDFEQCKIQKYPELITHFDPKSRVSEAYKGLRTSILFSAPGEGGKSILVTSAGPKEGKSLTVANLAITLGQIGNRVCILDCDMRKPRLHKIFRIPDEPGLSSILAGHATPEQVMQNGFIPGIKVVPCGQKPPNPSELLGSTRMQVLIKTLKKDFDYIIIDSPPLAAVTDSVLLARISDGICMVIKGGDTSREVISRGMDLLINAHANILGAVINNIDVSKKMYYYYYQYYYYNYYGDELKENKKAGLFKRRRRSSETHAVRP